MWGHQREASTIYKRMSTRENGKDDLEDNDALLENSMEAADPSWKLSFPHVIVGTLSSFLFGYHLGVVNEPLESISSDLGFSGNTMAEGLVVSTCLAGALFGSILSGWVADGVGRRRAFQLCALPMIIGAFISATTNNLAGMLLGRLFVGTGMGLGPPVAALYVTEISPPNVRGTYGSFIQIATCLGLLGALLIGIPVKEISGWWRVCFWVSAIPAAILAVAMVFCVESPHWLYKQGRTTEAEAEFEKLFGGSQHVKIAMAELSKTDRGDNTDTVKLSELFCGRHFKGKYDISLVHSSVNSFVLVFFFVGINIVLVVFLSFPLVPFNLGCSRISVYSQIPFAVVFIGSTLFALQQLSGINAVFYFSSTVFRSAGVPSNLANGCIGIANLSGSIAAMVLMDKLGRKLLLLWSFSGMAISMVVQAMASYHTSNSVALCLSVGGMLMFVLSFAIGAGPVPGLLLPEIFPGRIRAKAMAVCMSVHWVINFFVGLLFLRLLEQLGPRLLYSIFASFCVMAVIFVNNNVVETKGKSLQEIEIALLPQE